MKNEEMAITPSHLFRSNVPKKLLNSFMVLSSGPIGWFAAFNIIGFHSSNARVCTPLIAVGPLPLRLEDPNQSSTFI